MGLLAGSEITPLFLKYFCGYLKTERGLADVSSQALKNDSKQEKGMPPGASLFLCCNPQLEDQLRCELELTVATLPRTILVDLSVGCI